jgi:hypothetical protein
LLGTTQSHPASSAPSLGTTLSHLAGELPFTGLALLWSLLAALALLGVGGFARRKAAVTA